MPQPVALGPIPIEKYSYALSNENVRHHVWRHDTRRELLLLKVVRVESNIGGSFDDTSLQIVVMAGTESLERLDTQTLVRWAREHEQRLRQGLVPAQTELPVQVVVKFPCIAMRYPDQPPMIRRFQLKFGNETDYLTVRDLLRDVGFPIKESSGIARLESRASTATPRSNANRLTSSSLAVPDWQRTTASHLSQSALGHGSSSSHHGHQFQPSIPSRMDTSSALSMRPPSIMSPDIERLRSSSAMDSTNGRPSPSVNFRFQPPPPLRRFQTPPTFGHNQHGYGQELGIQSSQISQPQTEQETARPLNTVGVWPPCQSQYSQSQTVPARDRGYDAMSSNVSGSHQPEESQMPSYDGNPPSQYFSEGLKLRRSSTAQGSQAVNIHRYEPLGQLRHHSSLYDSMHRPMSTPLTGSQYDMSRLDTSSWIPPKRDLPFPFLKAKEPKKPEPATQVARQVTFLQEAGQQTPHQRPISPELESAAVHTPPPTVKTPPPPAAKPPRKRAAPRKKTAVAAAALPREIPDSEERPPRTTSALPQEPVSPLVPRGSAIPRPATAPPSKAAQQARKRAAATNIAPPAKAVRMVNSSTQTQTGSGRDHTALPRSVTVSQPSPAPAAVEESYATSASAPAATRTAQRPTPQPTPHVLDGIGEHMADFVGRFAQPGRPLEIYELPEWDTATESERHDIVENWMIEQLQDPKFIELCRTVEGTWHRIGIP